MQTRLLVRGAVCAVLVLALAVWSTAQLSGNYTIDPNGSGPSNYTTFAAASAALAAGVSGPVVFQVASTTFQEAVTFNPVTGTSAANTITFVATGNPAVIDANGAQDGLVLNSTCSHFLFDNFVIKGFTRYGLSLAGASATRATFCTFRNLMVDAPATTSTSVYAVYCYYNNDCIFEDCVFAGGGRVFYTQQINRNFMRRCEFDGKGQASQLASLWNSNDSDNLYENCFYHDCGPSGYAMYIDYSQYGNMIWHNTFLVNTSQAAVRLGSLSSWSRANSFRNNIIVNTGTGGCIWYGASATALDCNDPDYNCYWAPNGNVIELQNGTTFTKGTLAQWLAFFTSPAGQAMIPAGGGTTWDNNSIEANPGLVSMTAPYDIHLTGGSPCINAGTKVYVAGPWISYNASYVVATDGEGDPRDATPDIGADEVVVSIVGSGSGLPGTSIAFALLAAADAGLPYQMGSSFGNGPIPIDTRTIGLSLDSVLVLSIGGTLPGIFQNYAGLLDAQGKATASFNIPNIPTLKGIRIYTAFVTLSPAAPSGVSNISNSFLFTIQ
ncbi:MAG: right-handed parallel beta-helix repeat-containing protein [Planctomycetes bacterium]|nr:right-handed parallel beta-helix repeat-containing protein [Planctomycetota bacterium]